MNNHPIGEARLNKLLRHQALRTHQAETVARACREAQDNTTYRTTAAGDERKLRGIPAIGRNVQGVIGEGPPAPLPRRSTSPHADR
jgi:hypothetical protein